MTVQLDHFFILTEEGAPLADLLVDIGLVEGTPNNHPGQGTANRRFFLANTGIEFLYLRDAYEANNGPGRKLKFVERTQQEGASPFGIIVRTTNGLEEDVSFAGWKYFPDYFNGMYSFHVGDNSDLLEEPLCICMPVNLPRRNSLSTSENTEWELTKLQISLPVNEPSSVLSEIARCDGVYILLNKPHYMELEFNRGEKEMYKNFSPDLPLSVSW